MTVAITAPQNQKHLMSPFQFENCLCTIPLWPASNYALVAFLNMALNALLPLLLAMPFDIGGLDLDPPKIGYSIGSYGAGSAVFQAFYFAHIVRYLDERRIFACGHLHVFPHSFRCFLSST